MCSCVVFVCESVCVFLCAQNTVFCCMLDIVCAIRERGRGEKNKNEKSRI